MYQGAGADSINTGCCAWYHLLKQGVEAELQSKVEKRVSLLGIEAKLKGDCAVTETMIIARDIRWHCPPASLLKAAAVARQPQVPQEKRTLSAAVIGRDAAPTIASSVVSVAWCACVGCPVAPVGCPVGAATAPSALVRCAGAKESRSTVATAALSNMVAGVKEAASAM